MIVLNTLILLTDTRKH